MGVKYIFSQAGNKMGLDPSVLDQRAVLTRILNEAAPELYMQSDIVGSLVEQVFKVNSDQTISLPQYVWQVRAIREFYSQIPWHINQMRPRYNQFNWQDQWRNYRLKNRQALMTTVTNQSVGVISVGAVENPPIVVSLSGPTATSTSTNEDVVMDSNSKQTVNAFLDYSSVKKDRVNGYDVTLSDVDGKVLTIIPNNALQAEYQIVDVSLAPWLAQNVSPTGNYVEILYKKALPYLTNDSDEYPALDCDNILVNKMMQLWGEEQGKADMAAAYDTKATRTLARLQEEQNRETEDCVSLVVNPHDRLLQRVGGPGRRYWRTF